MTEPSDRRESAGAENAGGSASSTAGERLPLGALLAYGVPTAGASFIAFLLTLYIFKYATDVLLIAPAAMGLIFAVARIWDAISDPLVGYLSDRTQTRFGRRRPWLFGAVIPFALVPVMMWSPPEHLDGLWLIVWMTVAILAYETVLTIFFVPHLALGGELSMDRHERTRVFAFRQVAWSLGFFACVGAVYLLTTAEDKRAMAFILSGVGGLGAAGLILFGAIRLREHASHIGRGAASPLSAFKDVMSNPPARMLIFVFLIENLGIATLGIMAPYFMQYVIKAESAYSLMLLFHFVPSLLMIPVGVMLARRYGKRLVWGISMVISGISYGASIFAGEGDVVWVMFWVTGTGIAVGVASVVGPSLQADVIDYDEHRTGERKEGAYFALWNFVRKAATGITGALAGFALQMTGFEPNMEQTEGTLLSIRFLYAGVPAIAMLLGATLYFTRFRFDEADHLRIRAELNERNKASR
ncbi:MAG: glycoside-pentoside-hexuronide (GPH):cation symporter [Novosphingobium sp.]|nr:glycoside-pentoside-hexuronide (GPH):cation symporter [Novosphingobium sp.]